MTLSKHTFEFAGKSDSLVRASGQAQKALGSTDDQVKKTDKGMAKLGGTAKAFIAGIGVAAVAAFAAASIKAFQESEKAQNRLEQVFEATGETTGQAAQDAADYAGELSKLIGVDDELIMAAQAVLATFESVSSEAARGAGVFDRATAAAADLAAAGFGTLESNAQALGKALDDPAKGLTALKRIGVIFTEQQKEQIAVMIESGDVLGAQNAILAEIEGKVGGTAEATATSMDKMAVAIDEIQEKFGEALVPALEAGIGLFEAIMPHIEAFASGLGLVIEAVSGMEGGLAQAAAAIPILVGALALLYANPVIAGIGLVVAGIVAIGAAAKNEQTNVAALTEDLEALGRAGPDTITELIDPDALDVANDMGISMEALADVINGSEDAFHDWVGATRDAGFEMENVQDRSRLLTDAVSNLRQDTQQAREEQQRLGDTYRATGSDEENLIARLGTLADAQTEAKDATEEHTTALQKQIDKTRAATDPVFAFRDAKRAQREATEEATAALDEFGLNSPEYNKALDDLAKANINASDAALDLANVDLDAYRRELVQSGIQSGLTAAEAREMADDIVADLQRVNDKTLSDKAFNVTTYYRVEGQPENALASGGPVQKGDVALVGERGPEVVLLGAAGRVVPNDALRTIAPSEQAAVAPPGLTIVVNFNGTVFGGQRDITDVVVQSITQAQQTGRLPRQAMDRRPARPPREHTA